MYLGIDKGVDHKWVHPRGVARHAMQQLVLGQTGPT